MTSVLGALPSLTSKSTESIIEERYKQIIIMQCYKYGNEVVYKCCGCIEEGMPIFIWEIHEDFIKKKIFELDLGS